MMRRIPISGTLGVTGRLLFAISFLKTVFSR
jgi:hypothetical protein